MKSKISIVLLAIVSFFSSCKIQDEFDTLSANYHPEVAVPIFNAKTNFKDVVGPKSTSLKIDADGKMHLYYKGTVSERRAVDALKIFPNGIQVPFSDTSLTQSFKSDLDLYKVVLAKKSTITTGCLPPANFPEQIVDGFVTIPNLTKNGVVYKKSFNTLLKPNVPFTINTESLDGYVLTFDQPTNSLTFKYEAKQKSDGKNVTLLMAISIQNLGFTYCEAYMKKQDLQLDAGKVDLDFYDDQQAGNLNFEDPRITVLVDNSYGFPMRTKINYIKSISINNDTTSLVAKGLTDDGFDFPYPSLTKGEVGQTKTFAYDFTNSTSNIRDILNSKPKTIWYNINAVANPYDEKGVGFITDSTSLKFSIEVDIPLYGSAKDFSVKQDFQDVDFGKSLENVQTVELKLISDNSLPVEVLAQIDFLDQNDKVLTQVSDLPIKIVDAATLNASGNTTGAVTKETLINFDQTKTNLLRQCKKAQVKFYFSTANNGTIPVHIYANQNVSLRMGLKAKTQF